MIWQTEKDNILVRDDGSTDSTLNILREYESRGYLLWYQSLASDFKDVDGKIGKSHLDFCRKAPDSEYYVFADQAVAWVKEKLSVAVKALEKFKHNNTPLLYCSHASP